MCRPTPLAGATTLIVLCLALTTGADLINDRVVIWSRNDTGRWIGSAVQYGKDSNQDDSLLGVEIHKRNNNDDENIKFQSEKGTSNLYKQIWIGQNYVYTTSIQPDIATSMQFDHLDQWRGSNLVAGAPVTITIQGVITHANLLLIRGDNCVANVDLVVTGGGSIITSYCFSQLQQWTHAVINESPLQPGNVSPTGFLVSSLYVATLSLPQTYPAAFSVISQMYPSPINAPNLVYARVHALGGNSTKVLVLVRSGNDPSDPSEILQFNTSDDQPPTFLSATTLPSSSPSVFVDDQVQNVYWTAKQVTPFSGKGIVYGFNLATNKLSTLTTSLSDPKDQWGVISVTDDYQSNEPVLLMTIGNPSSTEFTARGAYLNSATMTSTANFDGLVPTMALQVPDYYDPDIDWGFMVAGYTPSNTSSVAWIAHCPSETPCYA